MFHCWSFFGNTVIINGEISSIIIKYIYPQTSIKRRPMKQLRSTLAQSQQFSKLKQTQIENLKQEVFQLKDLEYDLFKLNDQIAGIQAKYSMTLEQRDRNQNLARSQMVINRKNVEELKNDVNSIKQSIANVTLQVANIARDNSLLESKCQNKENQITRMNIALKELQKNNQFNSTDLKESEQALQKIRQCKARAEEECQKLVKKINENRQNLIELQKQTKNQIVIEKSLTTTLQNLRAQGQELTIQMKARQKVLKQTSQKHDALDEQVKQALEQNAKLDKQSKSLQQICSQLTKTLETLQRKNQQKCQTLTQTNAQISKTEQQLSVSVLNKDKLLKDHSALATQNKQLNLDIDDCLLKIIQLENVNKILVKNIQHYINCDEEARVLLDRRNKMTELLKTVGQKLSRTQANIAHLM